MYPIHPLLVHLPIGLLLGNLILTLLYLWRRDASHEVAAYHCLWIGLIGVVPAILSGTFDAVQHLYGPQPRPDALPWINAHAIAGLALAVAYWSAWQLRRKQPRILDDPAQRGGYLIRLGIGVTLLVLSGWLGGQMTYTLGLGIER